MASELLGFTISLGQQDFALAVSLGADPHRLLLSLGPVLSCDPLSLGPHAREDRLLILLREVQAFYLNVDELDAEPGRRNRARRRVYPLHDRGGLDAARFHGYQIRQF